MKACELLDKGNELHHKVRSVSDLIRHVKTREAESKSPNYNLFFGAGCSVSSGIRPAGQLIDEWLKELYERFQLTTPDSIEQAKEYFQIHHSNWYNKENPYSSLFEKTYEFATQRRRFVETEVDKALPAIGYAYLTALVEEKFFGSIFTTNFDDLINEAFYQFSNERPLVCAHDSSIKSISITSKRPKIIKLHGDYLFNDIKSTLRETESLEQNTKEKLIDFCKEFGLIIVGYSGNDRSIMDVLDFLTKQENFLQNGLYWCLRGQDEVNHSLQNLLWKEKVYPVIIDGFDELFAEIHAKSMRKGLDFEASLKNSKLQQIKNNILSKNDYLNKNKYIRDDVNRIKETNDKQEISDFLNSLNINGESEDLSLTEFRNLLEIEDLSKKLEHEKAYRLAENFYHNTTNNRDKARYISKLISISNDMRNSRSCITWCDKLMEIDPNNISYIIKKSRHIKDLSSRYSFLSSKSKQYEWKYKLHNHSALSGYNLIKNDPTTSEVDITHLISKTEKSLQLNPSLSNQAWHIKVDLLLHSKKLELKKGEDIKKQIEDHITEAKKISSKNLNTLDIETKVCAGKYEFEESRNLINTLYAIHEEVDTSEKSQINGFINLLVDHLNEFDKPTPSLSIAEKFYETHLQDKEIKHNSEILLGKASFYIARKNNISKAQSYFLSALECVDIIVNFEKAISLNSYLNNEYNDKLVSILKENKHKIIDKYYYYYMHNLLKKAKENHTQAIEYLEKSYVSGLAMAEYYSSLSYTLVLSEKYQELIDIGKTHKEKIIAINNNTFNINFQYAAKMLSNEQYDPIQLRNITAKSKDPGARLAAFALLDQEIDVKRILSEQINISYHNYYLYKEWPIIRSDMLDEALKAEGVAA
ncbi:MAG: SIR2 family protein [Agarilytica sp.]